MERLNFNSLTLQPFNSNSILKFFNFSFGLDIDYSIIHIVGHVRSHVRILNKRRIFILRHVCRTAIFLLLSANLTDVPHSSHIALVVEYYIRSTDITRVIDINNSNIRLFICINIVCHSKMAFYLTGTYYAHAIQLEFF